MLHHGPVGEFQNKNFKFSPTFFGVFIVVVVVVVVVVVFHHKICTFIIFISFVDDVSKFRNRILTNRKHELVVSNCQQNCMVILKPYSRECFKDLRLLCKPFRYNANLLKFYLQTKTFVSRTIEFISFSVKFWRVNDLKNPCLRD